MKKILLIGTPGAGKTYFGNKLSDITGIPIYYLDNIRYQPDKTPIPPVEFNSKVYSILTKDSFIIDGNYLSNLPSRLTYCDTVFLFDIPSKDCISGIKKRLNIKRADLPFLETDIDPLFKQYIIDFHSKELPKINSMLKDAENAKIYIFKSRKNADDFITGLKDKLQ